jgi:hypothetical protein
LNIVHILLSLVQVDVQERGFGLPATLFDIAPSTGWAVLPNAADI